MGCERRVVYDFVNVVHGEATLKQALIKDKRFDNLFVLAASQTRDKDALTKEGVEKVLKDLADDGFDYIVCDSPAGIEKGAFLAMYFADKAVVVVNPEVSSVRDSDRILGLLAQDPPRRDRRGRGAPHLLLTRYSPQRVENGEMLSHHRRRGSAGPEDDRRDPRIRRRAQRLQQGRAGDPGCRIQRRPGLRRRRRAPARRSSARCASPSWRRRASSASCSGVDAWDVRFPQAQEDHRDHREEPPADHHRAGAQPAAARRITCRCCSARSWK
jgi:hypothetical protein